MKMQLYFVEFLLILSLVVTEAVSLKVNTIELSTYEKLSLVLNASTEYVLIYPPSKVIYPYRVTAWVSDKQLKTTKSVYSKFPVLMVVRQAKQVSSWTIPEMVETTKKDKTLYFYHTSKTLCHEQMDNIIYRKSGTEIPMLRILILDTLYILLAFTRDFVCVELVLCNDDDKGKQESPTTYKLDTIFSHLCQHDKKHYGDPIVGPLSIAQSFIVAISTSSTENVEINIMLEEETNFYVLRNVNYGLTVSPSQSRYVYFKFDNETSDTVVISVDSVDEVCLTVSVQDCKCPVMDSNKDVQYEGVYQTMNMKGALTVTKSRYPDGFFLVFVAKPDNYDCSQESSLIPLSRLRAIHENNITSEVTFIIKDSINKIDYAKASVGTIVVLAAFGFLFTGMILIFHRFGTISKIESSKMVCKDSIEPLSEEEKNSIVLSEQLTVDTFAKYPRRIKQRSFNYLAHTISIAIFYSIPVIQLVVTYQRVVNLTGDEDTCYYNFLCAHPAFKFSDFNHIFSNVGYVFIGLFFNLAVLDRQYRIGITKDKGIPVHYGLFHAMGVALIIEGILSGCYHICPSQSNYQFDTSFMYVMAVLIMVKLYQNRHPDINATAYSTFSIMGIAILMAMIGILDGTLFFWIAFIIAFSILIITLSLKIYYVNLVIYGTKQLYNSYQRLGFCRHIFIPIRKGRFVVIAIANLANFSILGSGLYIYLHNLTDFGTFLLGLLLANSVLHISFYTIMKILNKEKICLESIFFGILGFLFWLAAGIFFLDAATLWTVTPAESRQWNQGCIFLEFYDKHDIWHLLSAPALYFTFLYLMFLDDGLCNTAQKEIIVF